MLWSTDLLVTEAILFLSMGLFFYWVLRALLIVAGTEEEINRALDSDLWWGQRFWLALRLLLGPPSQTLSL
jgi:hypothetical protein